jgi:hypothetical protein
MIGQGESTFQMQSVSLELLQEAVVEARSGKMNVWESLVAPGLSDKGKSTGEIARLTLRKRKATHAVASRSSSWTMSVTDTCYQRKNQF